MSKMKKRGNEELSVIGRKQLCGGASISHRDAPTKSQIGKLRGMKEGTDIPISHTIPMAS